MKAALYLRVSTEDQAKHGYSLPAQADECHRKAEAAGAAATVTYSDNGWSAGTLDRPALERLRADVRAGAIDTVITLDPDRLSRDLVHLLLLTDEFEAAKVPLVFVTMDWQNTPEGRLFLSMRGAVAEFERAKIRERGLRGRKKKIQGGGIGSAPVRLFGYRYQDGALTVVEDEAAVVRRIFDLCGRDGSGTMRIAQTLRSEGVPAPKGARWHPGTIVRILRNPVYAGQLRQFAKGKLRWDLRVRVPAILSQETWDAAQAAMQHHLDINPGRAASVRAPLLAGIGRCGVCGGTLYCQGGYRTQPMSGYYVCGNRKQPNGPTGRARCTNRYHKRWDVDAAVWQAIVALLREDDAVWARRLEGETEDEAEIAAKRAALERQVGDLRGARERVMALVVRGTIGQDEADQALRNSSAQLQRAQSALRAIVTKGATRAAEANRLLEGLSLLRAEAEAAATPEARRAVARRLLEAVVLHPDGTVELVPKAAQGTHQPIPS